MKKIEIDAKELKYWNEMLQKSEIDFEAEKIAEDETLFCKTVKFDDGIEADLRVCSGQTNLWCEAVWYDNGCEMYCSDACADTLEGIWECIDEKYTFEVVAK